MILKTKDGKEIDLSSAIHGKGFAEGMDSSSRQGWGPDGDVLKKNSLAFQLGWRAYQASISLDKELPYTEDEIRKILDEDLDDAIKRRLRAGATKTEVCRELGVDRAKVDAICHYIYSDADAE